MLTPVKFSSKNFPGITTWLYEQIYIGPNGGPEQKYVPEVDDIVWSWSSGGYRVTAVDESTSLSTLVPYNLSNLRNGVRQQDILLGNGPRTDSSSYRVYVDTRTTPHRAAIDTSLKCYGNNVTHLKLFRGTDISSVNGQVISALVDGSGNMTSENVPMSLVALNSVDNYAIKVPNEFYLTETLADGEPVTAVTYNNAGAVTSVTALLIVRTNFIRSIDQSKRIVSSIRLVSAYLSTADSTVLEVPLNLTLSSVSLVGKVTYNDGNFTTYPVDGVKFELMGKDNYVSSSLGQSAKLLLAYRLSPDEFSNDISGDLPNSRSMTKEYTVNTVGSDSVYSAKIYALPKWNPSINKYELDWVLYNLDRDTVYNINEFIEYAAQSPEFVGDAYEATQRLTVSVNLESLGSSFSFYRHVQVVQIQLRSPASLTASSYYTVLYGEDSPIGLGLSAKVKTDPNDGTKRAINIANGASTEAELLEILFAKTYPLIIRPAETTVPSPDSIRIKIGSSFERVVTLTEALSDIGNISVSVGQGTQVRLEFFIDAAPNNIELSSLALIGRN